MVRLSGIAPSLMCADLYRLADQVTALEGAGGVVLYHVDVMDGRYVPNFALGPGFVRSLRPHTRLPIEVHLMVEEPERHLELFADAGADIITVHVEATRHLYRTLRAIRALGRMAGVALEPATPLVSLHHVWCEVDLLLLMTVESGLRGQPLIPFACAKIAQARHLVDRAVSIAVDGAMQGENIAAAVRAGADVVVVGSAVFGAGPEDLTERARRLSSQVAEARQR